MNDQKEHPRPVDPVQRMARYMFIGFWILLLTMGYLGAQRWLERAANLNSSVETEFQDGKGAVLLKGNRYGHYVATGAINDTPVKFLVDTGATTISIPEAVADRLSLQRGRPRQVTTANGLATVYDVVLDSVSLGELARHHVQAHINPHLPGDEILLGMTYLRHFELRQRAETLTIRQP